MGVREGADEWKRARRKNGRAVVWQLVWHHLDEEHAPFASAAGSGGRGGEDVSPYEYRCNVRIVVARLPVERRVTIMRSYNIATPRNDIKLSPQ